jgi:hypothetical protein
MMWFKRFLKGSSTFLLDCIIETLILVRGVLDEVAQRTFEVVAKF